MPFLFETLFKKKDAMLLDNFFTNTKLAETLKREKTTILGTVKNKKKY